MFSEDNKLSFKPAKPPAVFVAPTENAPKCSESNTASCLDVNAATWVEVNAAICSNDKPFT